MTSPSDLTKQQDFVLRTLEERNIRFVRLWFTDVLGFLKSVAIAPAELENAFAEGIGFDGSAIEGFARVTEADMLAKPDPASFSILPWRTESPGAARMFCDISLPDGTAASVDPRRVLRQTLEKVAKLLRTSLFILLEPEAPVNPDFFKKIAIFSSDKTSLISD